MTFAKAIGEYIDTCEITGLSTSTTVNYRGLARIAYGQLNDRRVDQISAADVQRQVNAYAADHSVKSVKNMYGLLHSVMKLYAPRLNLSTIKLPTNKNKLANNLDQPIQSDDDLLALLNESADDPDLYLCILIAAEVGLRRS